MLDSADAKDSAPCARAGGAFNLLLGFAASFFSKGFAHSKNSDRF
jgi:hypothetical protein